MFLPLVLALWSCTDSTTSTEQRCEVTLFEAVPATGAVGDTIEVTGTPLTDSFDTALYVGGIRAEIASLTRDGCDDYDTCVEDAACNVCGDCDACDLQREQECVEIVSFVVPQVAAGETTVQLFNNHGGSTLLAFTVLGGGDTGGDTGDTGDDTGDTGDSGDTSGDSGDTSADSGDTSGDSGDTGADTATGGDTGGADTASPIPPWFDAYPTCPTSP